MSEVCPTCLRPGWVRPRRKVDVNAFLAELYPGAVCAIIGIPRTGKTRGAQAADAAGVFRRRLVFDTYAARDRLEHARGKKVSPWPGRLLSSKQLLRNVAVSYLEGRRSFLDHDPLKLVITPEATSEAGIAEEFGKVGAAVWETGDIDLIAEEVGRYGRYATEMINQVSSGGGHAGVRFVVLCQSLTRIHKDCRRCISHVVAYAQGEEGDVAALRKRCGRPFAEAVARLRKGDPPLTWRLGDAH